MLSCMTPGVENGGLQNIDLPSERISLRKTPGVRITYSPNRRAMICICTPRSPHGGGVSALLASRSVKVDADSNLVEIDLEVRLLKLLPNVVDLVQPELHLVRVAEARAKVHLHAIVNAELLTDQRPLKLHLVLRLVAEAERDLRIRSAGQVRAREELHLRLEARDAGQQPRATELGTRVEVAVAHVVRLQRDLSADLVRRLLVDKLLDEQPRVRARLNVEGALHQIVVHAKLDVVAVRLHLLAQLQHRVRRSLHVDREVQRPGPVSAQPIVS